MQGWQVCVWVPCPDCVYLSSQLSLLNCFTNSWFFSCPKGSPRPEKMNWSHNEQGLFPLPPQRWVRIFYVWSKWHHCIIPMLLERHWRWLIVVQYCRKKPTPGSICSACFLTGGLRESHMKQMASRGIKGTRNVLPSQKIPTQPVPLKCTCHKAGGDGGKTRTTLESNRRGFR